MIEVADQICDGVNDLGGRPFWGKEANDWVEQKNQYVWGVGQTNDHRFSGGKSIHLHKNT